MTKCWRREFIKCYTEAKEREEVLHHIGAIGFQRPTAAHTNAYGEHIYKERGEEEARAIEALATVKGL